MKTVTRVDKLTKEQEAQMPIYAQKWIDIGLKTGEADWETFDKYMPIAYAKAGLVYPKNVVRVQSPLVGGLASAIAEGIWRQRRGAVGGAVGDAVGGAVGDAVGGAVGDAVGGAVGDAVRGAVDDAVGGAVDDAVRGAVDDAVRGAVDDAVGDAVDGAVCDAVCDAVDGAVGDAVRGAVRGAVDGAVDGAVCDAVDGAVGGAVCGAVRGAVRGAVPQSATAMEKEGINFSLSMKAKLGISIEWHYWLGGQFWVGYWYRGVAYVNFLFEVCGLKLSDDIMERAEANRKISESVNYIWPNKNFVMVCNRPQEIHRNTDGRLHNTNGMAIKYSDGWGLYYIHGVKFTEVQFNKVKDATVTDIIAWEDIDQRSALLRDRPIKELLEIVPKKLIDETEECGGYKLWELDLEGLGKTKVLAYSGWSSAKEYIKFVPPNSRSAIETVASLRHQTVAELLKGNNS